MKVENNYLIVTLTDKEFAVIEKFIDILCKQIPDLPNERILAIIHHIADGYDIEDLDSFGRVHFNIVEGEDR